MGRRTAAGCKRAGGLEGGCPLAAVSRAAHSRWGARGGSIPPERSTAPVCHAQCWCTMVRDLVSPPAEHVNRAYKSLPPKPIALITLSWVKVLATVSLRQSPSPCLLLLRPPPSPLSLPLRLLPSPPAPPRCPPKSRSSTTVSEGRPGRIQPCSPERPCSPACSHGPPDAPLHPAVPQSLAGSYGHVWQLAVVSAGNPGGADLIAAAAAVTCCPTAAHASTPHQPAPHPRLLQKAKEGIDSVEGCEATLFQVGAVPARLHPAAPAPPPLRRRPGTARRLTSFAPFPGPAGARDAARGGDCQDAHAPQG